MPVPELLAERWRHARGLIRGTWAVISGVLGFLAFVEWSRDHFLPPEKRAALDAYGLLPASWWVILALLALVVGLIEGSYRQAQRLQNQVRETSPRVTQAVVNELAELRALGHRLAGEKLRDPADMQSWVERVSAWLRTVLEYLRREFPPSAAYSVEHMGSYRTGPRGGSINPPHRQMRGQIYRRLEILQEIINLYGHR
jgi:hypothetical protein